MTDIVVPVPVVTPPKSTSPEDLLDMYEAETPATPSSNGTSETKSDSPLPERETPSGDTKKEETSPKEETTQIIAKTEEPKIPSIKGKLGEKEVEIPEEAEITQKINGKDVTFKVKDALETFAKREEAFRTIDRRTSIVDRREKQLQGEYDSLKGRADKVIQAALTGDLMSCIRDLARLAAGNSQLNVVEFEKKYLDQIEQFRAPYSQMTPEQREKFFAERKAKVFEDELKRRTEEDTKREALGTLQAQIDSAIETNGLTKDEFWGAFKQLADTEVGPDRLFNSPNEITPENVVDQIAYNNFAKRLFAACEKNGVSDRFEELFDIYSDNEELSPKDLKTIWNAPQDKLEIAIKEASLTNSTSRQVVEDLNRRVAKNGNKAQFTQASSTKKNGKIEGYSSEEDVDFLYRNQPKTYQRIQR